MTSNSGVTPPLEGIRVLDLGQNVSGPYCARLLGDYGAMVVKVESPDGDPLRNAPPFEQAEDGRRQSLLSLYLNHDKKIVVLDIAAEEGRDALLDLVRDCDVVVEDFAPGTLDALGLTADVLVAANPRLIITRISAFGQSGPYRDFIAPDIVASAMGGLAYIHGDTDREPLTHGNPQEQYRAGVVAASATVAALLNRLDDDSQGEEIDVSMVECVAAALRDTIPQYTFMGAIRRRGGRGGGPGAITPCADGYVIPSGFGSADWSTFARFMDAPELDDERFATGDGRQEHAKELRELLRKRLQSWTMMEYFEGCQMWGMGAGIVLRPAQALVCEQHVAREFFHELVTESGKSLPAPRRPFEL